MASGRAAAPGAGAADRGRLAEFMTRHWWERPLHNQTAFRLRLRLMRRRNTIVANVPYHEPQA